MISLFRVVAALSACLVFVVQGASAEPSGPDSEVQALLETFHEAYGFPGATVAYVAAGGDVRSFAVGHSDVEAGIPMTPETRMLAASIGKTIWGALVLSLEAEGLIRRSDLVSDYLGDEPWFDHVPNADEITAGHLLNHTSGLPDHVHMNGIANELIAMGREDPFDPTDLVSFVLDEPALFEAGTAWSYTDTGYVLLGAGLIASK